MGLEGAWGLKEGGLETTVLETAPGLLPRQLDDTATEMLKDEGYDISYIHYTHLENWYGRLGYKTVVRWNGRGVIWSARDGR